MGTNYYAARNRPTTDGPIHIGKSSWGWLFLFQKQNEKYEKPPVIWGTYQQVKDWLYKHTVLKQDFVILDEYDRIISFDEFFEMVDAKQDDPHNKENPDNFKYCENVDGYRFTDSEFC